MTTIRGTSKLDAFSQAEESEASKNYNNILKEIEESQSHSMPANSNFHAAPFTPNSEYTDYISTNCYDRLTYTDIHDTMPLIINNHEAHQHSPPKLPMKSVDGCFIIEPAHSNSFSKNAVSCEGAVPLIKQELLKSEREHQERSKHHFENVVLNIRNKPTLVSDVAEAGSAVDVETVSQNENIHLNAFNEKTLPSWASNVNHHSIHIPENHIEPESIKNMYHDMFKHGHNNETDQFVGGSLSKYDKHQVLQHNPQLLAMLNSNPKVSDVPDGSHWEDFNDHKRIHTKGKSQQGLVEQPHTENIPHLESWSSNHHSLSQGNIETWLNHQDHHDHNSISYSKDHNNSSHSHGSEIWEKKPEDNLHYKKDCRETKRAVMPTWMMHDAHHTEHDIVHSTLDQRNTTDLNIKLQNTLPPLNTFTHSVIHDSKLTPQSSDDRAYIEGEENQTLTNKKLIQKSANEITHEKPWTENKNKTTEDPSAAWVVVDAHPAPDRAQGDSWDYQTMSSVMTNSHYHPIKHSIPDSQLHLQSQTYNHSTSPSPPTKDGDGRDQTAGPSPNLPAPPDGDRARDPAPGTSTASDAVMVSTFSSMAPYTMAGNYSSPPSYSGRDLYPGKPSSGYAVDSASPSSLYASSTGSLAMIPYVSAGQGMAGHQSMQGGHHWSGSQPPGVHDHQQGYSALASGLNLAAQNSLMSATSQAGGCDQGELNRAGFSFSGSSGHSYLRPDMPPHWGLIDPITGLQHPYCSDGMAHHLNQGKLNNFISIRTALFSYFHS